MEFTEMEVTLSKVDKEILESYKNFCEGLSDYLGDGYEIVLHSLENFDHSVIKILNGHYTGRSVGAPITDLALSMLEQIKRKSHVGYISYFSKNKKGEPLKSTTIAIQGEGGRIIGLLCINFYMNTPLAQLITNMYNMKHVSSGNNHIETYMDNIDDLIEQTVAQVRNEVLNDNSILSSNKNKEIISRLYNRGIFNLKDSVQKCAGILGISKNTVYMHLRNLNE